MIVKIFSIAILAVAFAQENYDKDYSDVDTLKRLTDEGKAAVEETLANINKTPKEFDRYLEERLNSLKWEGVVQKQCVNNSITKAVFKGMLKNKQFSNFQCISNKARDALKKLDSITNQIDFNTEKLKEKGLTEVMAFRLIISGFYSYVQDLFKTKSEELIKAESQEVRQKIIDEVAKNMKFLKTILNQINAQVNTAVFKFFEEYINYSCATENSLRNTQREGTKMILACVS